LAASAALGGALALGYFGGLWLTLARLTRARRPALLVSASLVVRLCLAGLGFYVVLGWGPSHLAVSLVAFLVVRGIMLDRVRSGGERATDVAEVGPWT
jgi:F1F0 ATPase subunit 2